MTAIGVIGRSEPRGLGIQTLEVARHVNPARVLLVEPQPPRWPTNREWYDQWPTTVAEWGAARGGDNVLDERTVRTWLDGLSVVYTAETLYDWRLAGWARRAGCRVVCHVNPELLPPVAHRTTGVTWWAPTPWLLDQLPPDTKIIPLPVATDRIPAAPVRAAEQPVRFVHVAGHAAMLDRNGTRSLATAVRNLRANCHLLVTGQDGRLPTYQRRDRRVRVDTIPGGVAHYWESYVGDVLVMPRRYGGLCMPAQEAMAAGMCVLMPACSPNDIWPGPRFRVESCRDVATLGGQIPVHEPDLAALRAAMEALANDPAHLAACQADAREWAAAHSWDALLPLWLAELGEAAACRR